MGAIKGLRFRKNKKLDNSPISYNFIPARVKIDARGLDILVSSGDLLTAGDIIAKGSDSFCLYSSVSGNVVSLNDGVVTVETIDKGTAFTNMPPFEKSIIPDSRGEMIDYIARAGIMYGKKPLHTKLSECVENGVTRLLINCMECLPSCSVSYRTVKQMPREVVGGAKILLAILGIRTGVFAIEKSKKKLASHIEKQNYDREMFIISLMPSNYPSDNPRMISSELFYSTPYDKILTVTPALCLQIYDAFVYGVPYVGHTISISSGKRGENLFVPAGSMLEELEEYLGVDLQKSGNHYGYFQVMAVVNSFVSGKALPVDEEYIRPYMNSLIFYPHDEKEEIYKSGCIECGECTKVCPSRIHPMLLYTASLKGDKKQVKLYGIDKCILCGCCSYVCPVGVEHINIFKDVKREVKNNDKA